MTHFSALDSYEESYPSELLSRSAVLDALHDRQEALARALTALTEQAGTLSGIASRLVGAVRSGQKVLLAGNGGSAAMAQHVAAELVGRFKRERSPYAALALTTDTSVLTAVGNDYGYEEVFARQVLALGRAGDVMLLLSTSGRSPNLVRAASAGKDAGIYVAAVTGPEESGLSRVANTTLYAPGDDTALVQEVQLIAVHVLCDLVEAELASLEEDSW